MNRENKRKTFEKGYYKTHACRDAFTCKVCGRLCTPENAGSQHRNHCPNCLSSLHVDVEPGDRASDCGGIMEPVAVWVRRDGEWAVISRMRSRGKGGSQRGLRAMDMSFMGLSSAAVRLELSFPQRLQRWMMAHSPPLRTQTATGSMMPPQSEARSPGSSST